MDSTEKNGQPSMEEILASIRRIIAEEPAAASPIIDLKPKPNSADSGPSLDEHTDFELPSIFRTPAPAAEKSTPLFGRLTDAIRGATTASSDSKAAARHGDELSASAAEKEPGGDAGGTQPQFGTLSSLKGTRPDAHDPPRAAEPPFPDPAPAAGNPAPPRSSSWGFGGGRQPPPPSKVDTDVKRVMAPFKDTHFLQMTNSQPASEPAPSRPVAASFPSPEPGPPRRVDFGAIIPGHMDLPGVPGADPHRRPSGAAATEPPPQPWPDRRPVPPPTPEAGASVFGNPPQHGPFDPAYRPGVPAEEPYPPFHSVGDPPAQGASPTGAIEDTTAELLRPMLRQWLADNMPRMVEKALHIEVAESVRTGKKPTSQ